MLTKATPESKGLDSRHIKTYIERLNKRQMHMHSVLMMRGNDIIYEGYWAPYNKDYCHRMYSVTKSFVAVAIGLCIEDGLISLDDSVDKYFPEMVSEGVSNKSNIYSPIWPPIGDKIPLRPYYPPIPDGCRNISLASLAGVLHNTGYNADQIYDELYLVNQRACTPPLDDSEVLTIVNSITRYKR